MPASRLLLSGQVAPTPSFTIRTLLTILFRQRRVVLMTFCAVFLPILIAVIFLPGEYVSETRILVHRQRFDPVISANSATQETGNSESMSRIEEQDVNSEIDLLQSDDLLRQVALESGIWDHPSLWRKLLHLPLPPQEVRVAKAAEVIRRDLEIAPPNKSNMMTVRFHSSNRQQAADVLKSLCSLYLQKHLQVHRPAGSAELFNAEVEEKRRALQGAEAKLVQFTRNSGVVSADAENVTLLQKTAEFDALLHSKQAEIASTEQLIENLESQKQTTSPRITTMVKTSALYVENLKTTLHALQLQRTELLTKYQPEYRLVQDIDRQIEDTQSAIDMAQTAPTAEKTTDQDPTYLWVVSELAKSKSRIAALQADRHQTERTLREYRDRAVQLEALSKQQNDLTRDAKSAEESYLASLKKQSDARLSEALDRSQIMNVAVAEAPTVPVLPVSSQPMRLGIGFGLALLVALGLAFVIDIWDTSFRTPEELESVLAVPVLAAISHSKGIQIQPHHPLL